MTDETSNPEMSDDHYYALPRGTMLHEFEIETVIGHGGFGITYKAMDTHLRELVAIKEYLPGEIAVRTSESTVRSRTTAERSSFEAGLTAFLDEARLIASHRHPRIVDVRRFFKLNGTGYIVMQFESGTTLSRRLAAGAITPAEAMRVFDGILDGVDHLHQKGILHRDIKPGNVMLRPDGSPIIIDFGAARDFKVRNSRSVTSIATPGYAPPEQYGVGGQQGPWTDLYAIGAVAYKMVTGQTPADSLRRLRKDPLVPAALAAAPGHAPELLAVIDWMLKVEEDQRPLSVAAVRDALAQALPKSEAPAGVSARLPPQPVASTSRKAPFKAIAATVAILALLGGGYWGYGAYQIERDRKAESVRIAKAEQEGAARREAEAEARRIAETAAKAAADAQAAAALTASAEQREAEIKAQQGKAALDESERIARVRASYTTRLEALVDDPDAVRILLGECRADPSCSDAIRDAIQARLTVIAEDDANYASAGSEPRQLRNYLEKCLVCRHKAKAEQAIAQEAARQNAAITKQWDLRETDLRFAQAGYDLAQLRSVLEACVTHCPSSIRSMTITRYSSLAEKIADEEATYRGAGSDPTRLRHYAQTCTFCTRKVEALQTARDVETTRKDFLRTQLEIAGRDEAKLKALIDTCDATCDRELKSVAMDRWAAAKAERERVEQTSVSVAPASPQPSYWNHNGSRMELSANGSKRRFTYAVPRDAIVRQGVTPGTVLFEGNRYGDDYAGTAYVFRAGCAPLSYWVSGKVSADQRSVTVYGRSPKRGSGCVVETYSDESLTFTYLGN